jgi:hypothetical protein
VDDDIVDNESYIDTKNYFKHHTATVTPHRSQLGETPAPAYDMSITESMRDDNSYYKINSRAPNKLLLEEEEDLGSSSRPSSIQESQSSRKSLTKKS